MSRITITLIEDVPMTYDEFWRVYDRNLNGDDVYKRYRDRHQPYRWIAKSAGNGEPLAESTESYFNAVDCERAIELLFSMSTPVELVRIENGVEVRRPLR